MRKRMGNIEYWIGKHRFTLLPIVLLLTVLEVWLALQIPSQLGQILAYVFLGAIAIIGLGLIFYDFPDEPYLFYSRRCAYRK